MSTAVVTGAGRGIGRRIALRLARDGHAVAVNDLDPAEAVAGEITADGGRALVAPADVTDRDAVFALVDRMAGDRGGLDVMVANAGIAQVKTLLEVTPADLRAIFGINVFGVVYCLQAAAEKMIAQGRGGTIISAASIDEQLGRYLDTGTGEAPARYATTIPLGRVQTPDDVAAVVSYLAGPDANYMTGQAVMIDGGVVMV